MGRPRRIPQEAKPTTVSLTLEQQVAFQELAAKRMRERRGKPLLNEVVVEGLELVLRKEGWDEADLAKIFPIRDLPKAKVSVFPKRSRRRR